MENISQKLKDNLNPILIGLIFCCIYFYFTFSGNSICDCETTEKYNSNQTGARAGTNRFYHK